jgi:hypothetical protein
MENTAATAGTLKDRFTRPVNRFGKDVFIFGLLRALCVSVVHSSGGI